MRHWAQSPMGGAIGWDSARLAKAALSRPTAGLSNIRPAIWRALWGTVLGVCDWLSRLVLYICLFGRGHEPKIGQGRAEGR